MTPAFFDVVQGGSDAFCVPAHTLVGINVLRGYLVGVLREDGEIDSRRYDWDPPTACTYHMMQNSVIILRVTLIPYMNQMRSAILFGTVVS